MLVRSKLGDFVEIYWELKRAEENVNRNWFWWIKLVWGVVAIASGQRAASPLAAPRHADPRGAASAIQGAPIKMSYI